ncbi:MAG: class I SAM-dependent methyltransferase [Anaerolineales bacterium]|nr:class I SAM-dependent methyltransferase [Anaerolineales bacterium]
MDLTLFNELLTSTGQAALAAAAALSPREESFLAHLTRLQKDYPAPLAKAALETAILRRQARAKFSQADAMYFTREALEQASGERLSRYRAARYAGLGRVADLGSSLGGDSLGLAAQGRVLAVDRDPLRLALARENLRVYGLAEQMEWVEADLNTWPLPPVDGFFCDPARRAGGRRRFSVHDYEPPLSVVAGWLARAPAGGVKLSPGVDLAELSGYAAEVEFISVAGELKEATLWLGPLRTPGVARRATRLEAETTYTLLSDPVAEAAPPPPGPPLAYLYEPDPAILRAGVVVTLAAQLSARQLDTDIAYLTSDALTPTPWTRAFAVEEALPFQLKRLRERLRQLNVGRVTVKKRGSPIAPEDLIQQLRLKGDEERIVFLTHVLGEPYALLGRAL